MTGRADLGFKARIPEDKPAKIETKYLVGSLGPVELAPDVIGSMERWQKLSLELKDPELRKKGDWISVDKKRYLRKFFWGAGEGRPAVDNEYPAEGCGLELTELRYTMHGQTNSEWTLGLEAFGTPTRLVTILQSASRLAFSDGPSLRLSPETSLSYPSWLLRLVR